MRSTWRRAVAPARTAPDLDGDAYVLCPFLLQERAWNRMVLAGPEDDSAVCDVLAEGLGVEVCCISCVYFAVCGTHAYACMCIYWSLETGRQNSLGRTQWQFLGTALILFCFLFPIGRA